MIKQIGKRPSNKWHDSNLNRIKSDILQKIEGATVSFSPKKRLNYILSLITEYKDKPDVESAVYTYLLSVFALLYYEKHNGLNRLQIGNIFKIAKAVLDVNGISAGTTKVASLLADLEILSSQILRKEGRHLSSAWEHAISRLESRSHSNSGEGFFNYVLGNRFHRLGYLPLAWAQYERALNCSDLTDSHRASSIIGWISSLRLAGRMNEAEKICFQYHEVLNKIASVKLEAEWEKICRICQMSGKFDLMIDAVRNKRSVFYNTSFILEALLWANIPLSRQWISKMPSIATLDRRSNFNCRTYPPLFRAVTTISNCYNFAIPFPRRIKNLGKALERSSKFMSLNQEILFHAAVARFLAQSRSSYFSMLGRASYEAKSLLVTQGKSEDCLRLLGDLKCKGQP